MIRSKLSSWRALAIFVTTFLIGLSATVGRAQALETPRLGCNLKYLKVKYNKDGLPPAVSNVMQAVINYYNCQFTNNVSVNIDVKWEALPSGTLGQARRYTINVSYAAFRSALLKRRPEDLRYGTKFRDILKDPALSYAVVSRTSAGRLVVGLSDMVQITRAQAKALGLLPAHDPGVDSTITFSKNWDWTYTLYSPVPGRYSLFATAVHEIGHVLGFVSDVDDPEGIPTPVDLFRFSDASLAFGRPAIPWLADRRQPGCGERKFFLSGPISLTPSKICSLQGGCNRPLEFERGTQCGWQASHWRDDASIGIMDPTLDFGEWNVLSGYDIELFHHLGWNPAQPRIIEKPTGLPPRSTRNCDSPGARCAALP